MGLPGASSRLYAIANLAFLLPTEGQIRAWEERLETLVDLPLYALQLRGKGVTPAQLLRSGRTLLQKPPRTDVGLGGGCRTVVVNDRVDVALTLQAESGSRPWRWGVHVGQDDLSPQVIRDLQGGSELHVGRSTHNREQLLAALDEPVDLIAIGPAFATGSKADHSSPLGLEATLDLVKCARDGGFSGDLVIIGGLFGRADALPGAPPDALPEFTDAQWAERLEPFRPYCVNVAVIGALPTEGDRHGLRARAESLMRMLA